MRATRTYTFATTGSDGAPLHITGYQNEAESFTTTPNCMFLNFPGRNLKLVHGPQRTRNFMDDMTAGLAALAPVSKGGSRSAAMMGGGSVRVESYGEYDTVIAEGYADILGALGLVREDRRPPVTPRLEQLIAFYMSWSPDDSFVLACFPGRVKPQHPIVVSYEPRNPDVLTAPGLDGHDGNNPRVDTLVQRDFRVAFGVHGQQVGKPVRYSDTVNAAWAPTSVAGFRDNRPWAPNNDYVVPVSALLAGLNGSELAAELR